MLNRNSILLFTSLFALSLPALAFDRFTKIDANGNDLPADATDHVCVYDNTTNLLWEVKTDDGGLRDKDWDYTWYFNGVGCSSCVSSCYTADRCDTEKFAADVNAAGGLCGVTTGWVVPTLGQLQSIVDSTVSNPSIDINYFPNTRSTVFWTASLYGSNDSWVVFFDDGASGNDGHGWDEAVRLVREGQSLSSLILTINKTGSGTGTITSNPTGINCGTTCSTNFTSGTAITLTATPAAGSQFAGWSGDPDCSDGSVTMNANTSCTATFNLTVTAPTVITLAATNIAVTSATLNGSVVSTGAAATVSFDFGKETSPPNPLPLTREGEKSSSYSPLLLRRGAGGEVKSFTYTETIPAIPSSVYSSTAVAVTANKTALTCNTLYHYRVKAVNSAGTGLGADKTFTTAACPVVTVNSWLFPTNPIVLPTQTFTLTVTAKSNSQQIGSYRYEATFDASKLAIDYTQCSATNGVCAGNDAPAFFTANVNYGTNPATITLNGLGAIGPGNDLQLLTIHFKSQNTFSTTPVTLKTLFLDNAAGNSIGIGAAGASVNIVNGICGDADGNTRVNIVDALAIARKVVGMPPPPTVDVTLADVNQNGALSIVDALHIARYSIGLVIPPEVCKIGVAL